MNNQEINTTFIQELESPYKNGYIFVGWYTKKVDGRKLDFKKDIISTDIVLYAHWQRQNDESKLISTKTGYYQESTVLLVLSICASIGVSVYSLRKIIYK